MICHDADAFFAYFDARRLLLLPLLPPLLLVYAITLPLPIRHFFADITTCR